MPTVEEIQTDVTRLTDLVNHLNAVNTILWEQRNFKDTLLAEANNHRGILQTALAQRDAEIAELKQRLSQTIPEPTEPPTPSPEPSPAEPHPTEPPLPTPPPDTPPDTPPEEPTEPLPNPTPPEPVTVADLTLEATFNSITVHLPGTYPQASEVACVEFRTPGGVWLVQDTRPDDPQPLEFVLAHPKERNPLPLWSVPGLLIGAVLQCEPGTDYEVRVVTPDGVHHVGSVRTWPERIASRESLLAGVT